MSIEVECERLSIVFLVFWDLLATLKPQGEREDTEHNAP
jgi:hypothetical protein